MIMQLLAIAALVTWAVSTVFCFSAEHRKIHIAAKSAMSVVIGFVMTVVIFVMTGTLVALGSIALGVQW